ncbi:MAG TPA: DUF4062 domain-containing protein, partial [Candidatus Saccharimonadia bacterium]|nr:DUF4062 domain-containing protein [Candidatus Saccharimonadia bacterium]
MSTPKVFISATTADLASVRQVVKDALLAKGCHPIEQTNFPPDARTVSEMLRGRIGDCQALIHIVGLRYGAEPDPATLPPGAPRRSYTQMEYDIGRELQAKRGDKRFRVYTFLCPPGFPYDSDQGAAPEPEDKQELQRLHRAAFLTNAHLREEPADVARLRERILTLQEEMHQLRTRQTLMARITIAATLAVVLALVVVVWSVRQVKEDTARRDADLSAKMSQVQEALARIQQNSDPKTDPISKWSQDRMETELAKQMNLDVAALRALLTAGKTSVDALVAGQALLASGNQKEAEAKFDVVLQQEKAAAQRLRQAWEGKAQIAFD